MAQSTNTKISASTNDKPHHIPPGLRGVIPQLVVPDARRAIAFIEKAFGAKSEHPPMLSPDGKNVMHAFVRVGDEAIFLSDAAGFAKPTTTNLFLYVQDVDAVYEKAVAAGAKAVMPVQTMFWGDRWGMVEDPFGNQWQIATHVEDVSPQQMAERMQGMQK